MHGAAGAVGQALLTLGRLAWPRTVGRRPGQGRGAGPRARRRAD
jgi:hypothetical protein